MKMNKNHKRRVNMTKTLAQLHKEMNEYNESMRPVWEQEKKMVEARDLPNALRVKYAPSLNYLQKKELEAAEQDAKEQDIIYRELKGSVKHSEGLPMDLTREIYNWVVDEVSSDNKLIKMEKSVYESFAKAIDEYAIYKEAVNKKTEKVIQEIKPSNFRYDSYKSFVGADFKLGDKMPVIGTERGSVLGASSWVNELCFTTTTWNKVKKYRKEKSPFTQRTLWKGEL